MTKMAVPVQVSYKKMCICFHKVKVLTTLLDQFLKDCLVVRIQRQTIDNSAKDGGHKWSDFQVVLTMSRNRFFIS